VSNVKSVTVQGQPVGTKPPVALLDCGQASKVTKGYMWLILFEVSVPPFDRALM
jgi:hypothetical protein